jgi:Uma2 family endonuclease
MSSKALISMEEYLRTSYPEMGCEFVDGEVIEKARPPKRHSMVQTRLVEVSYELRKQAPLFALPELRTRTDVPRFRIPDVSVYAGQIPHEEVPDTPPYVCIEILSPDDRMQQVLAKLKEYRAWGVAHIWVINPADRSLHEYGSDGLREEAVLRLPEYGLQVRGEELFPKP